MKKKQMNWQFGFVLLSVLVFMAGCGSGGGNGSNNTSGGLSGSQQKAIAEAFSFSALSSAGGTASGAPRIMPAPLLKLQPVGAVPSTAELSELLFAAANNEASSLQGGKGAASYAPGACQPSSLVPPYSCPGGGNVYYTINLNCTMPSGCCGNNPATCSQDSMSINGMGSLIYNNCKTTSSTGESVLVNGTLTATLTSNATMQCGGSVVANAKVTITGMPTISVNGMDVCHGDVFITANASYSTSINASVSGTVCGQSIYETFNKGCAVDCGGGSCCALGTVCSTCSSPATCFGAAYPVDCCNSKACPSGYRCDTANNKCIL